MRRARQGNWMWIGIVLAMSVTTLAETAPLRSHRLEGKLYVTVADVAGYYHLGRGVRHDDRGVEYRTAASSLAVEADSREIQLDNVKHWLSAPVLSARDQFWMTPLDVLKTIDPILRRGRTEGRSATETVVIDPGHGGADEGTHGANSREKDMTLDLAKRVKRDLAGVPGLHVLLTRTADVTTPLEDRVEFSRSEHADLYVSLHFNSGGTADGIETYCVPPAGAPITAHAPYEGETEATGANAAVTNNRFDEQNVWLAHCVQKCLLQATHANDRGVRRARFYVLRNAVCPAILVEAGFLSNRSEEAKILTSEYRDVLAKAIAWGIETYTGKSPGKGQP
ncbi:MAG TPA: N-acetylmuramoyl-L-alanine amidase [Verrucomicrobiae bacterium]|nr:N-acetylmuramoyl-L-alanine amidase [Verrucomicrobiae bacterium]